MNKKGVKKSVKKSFSTELNVMFDHLIKQKDKSLQDAEALKKEILVRLDKRIDALYKKRDFIAEILANRPTLKQYRRGVWKRMLETTFWWNVRYIVSMPFIYSMVIPGIIMHVFAEIYMHICFPLYGIELVNPKEYFIFDRSMLPYLNWLEKINCAYCSYFNGLISYMREIAGRTERYWCPIKHAKRLKGPHDHYDFFIDYSDGENLKKEWTRLRKFEEEK